MVKVQAAPPLNADGLPDRVGWVAQVASAYPRLNPQRLASAVDSVSDDDLAFSLELANLLLELNTDQTTVLSGIVYREVRFVRADETTLATSLGRDVVDLANAVVNLASASLLEMSNSHAHDTEQASQVENVKRMLIGMVDDPRVAVLKLAERVVALRHAKTVAETRRQRISDEALAIFAPLAGRLGIGRLKWELEDLAFRYTQGDVYMSLAKQLSGKRVEREQRLHELEMTVAERLAAAGIEARVFGRAKHIYSIYRKMRAKGVELDQVYDIQAVRVIVESMPQCYAALGVIHTSWPHVPSEFDDYVANPKENGYQSIHTAVTVDGGQMLEIQIRTDAMHDAAELGLCAHWSYKGDAQDVDDRSGYDAKMDWLRQVIEWHEDLGGTERLGTLLAHRVNDERIYVSTPKGHVFDLPRGATVLDFAYRVHTDVGHSAVRALVDADESPLYRVLGNSQQVSVITEPGGTPRREWLERELGFAISDRARAKIVSYFRSRDAAELMTIGRALIEDNLRPLDVAQLDVDALAAAYRIEPDTFLMRVGNGEIKLFDVAASLVEGDRMPRLGASVLGFSLVGRNRDGLLLSITEVVKMLGLTLTMTTGTVRSDTAEAVINIEIGLSGWRDGVRLAAHLRLIPGVLEVLPWSSSD